MMTFPKSLRMKLVRKYENKYSKYPNPFPYISFPSLTIANSHSRIHKRRPCRRRRRVAGCSVAPAGLAHAARQGSRLGRPSRCPWPTMAWSPGSAPSQRPSLGSGSRARCLRLTSPFTSSQPLRGNSPNSAALAISDQVAGSPRPTPPFFFERA